MSAQRVSDDNLIRYDNLLKQNAALLARNKAYQLGEIVQKGQVFLKCITAGTTDTTALSITSTNINTVLTDGTVEWQVIDPFSETKVRDWEPNVKYEEDRIIVRNGIFYRCTTTHTSSSTFDSTKWEQVGVDETMLAYIPNWQANKQYKINQCVLNSGNIYRCKETHTSLSNFDITKWELIYAQINDWESGYNYTQGMCIIYDNLLYKCNTSHTSSSFSSDISYWTFIGLKNNAIRDWVANTAYKIYDIIEYDHMLYRATVDFTSGNNIGEDFNNSRWELVYANIQEYTPRPHAQGTTILRNMRLYKSVSNSYISSFFAPHWRPYIPNIDDWKPYKSAADANMLSYFKFDNPANPCEDSMGNNVTPVDLIASSTILNLLINIVPGGGLLPDESRVPRQANFGDFLLYTASNGAHSQEAFALDMRQWFMGTVTAQDVYEKIFELGGLTIEFFGNLRGSSANRALFAIGGLPNMTGLGNCPRDTTWGLVDRYPVSYMGNTWHHSAIEFVIDSYDLSTGGVSYHIVTYADGSPYYTGTSQSFNYKTSSIPSNYYFFRFFVLNTGEYNHPKSSGYDDMRIWGGLRYNGASYTPPTQSIDVSNMRSYSYLVGEFVIHNNKLYRCLVENTDTAWDETHWEKVSVENAGEILVDWQPSNIYKVGDVVIHNNKIYRCNTAHTADSSDFSVDIANWDLLGGGNTSLSEWQTSTTYMAGDVVTYNGSIFRALLSHTSDSTDFATDKDNWEIVTADIKSWESGKYYKAGVTVIYNNRLWRCTADNSRNFFSDYEFEEISPTIDLWKTYQPFYDVVPIAYLPMDNHPAQDLIGKISWSWGSNSPSGMYINTQYKKFGNGSCFMGRIKTTNTAVSGIIGKPVSSATFTVELWFNPIAEFWNGHMPYACINHEVIAVPQDTVKADQWFHVVYTFDFPNNTFRAFLDGTEITSPYRSTNSDDEFYVSSNLGGGRYGCFDDIVIMEGIKYTSDFTPPTSPYMSVAAPITYRGYRVGDIVIYEDKLYRCVNANQDSTFVPTNWQLIGGGSGGGSISIWATSTDYNIDDVVLYDDRLFRCNTAHTSSTFYANIANWDVVYASIKPWQTNIVYTIGNTIIEDGCIYKCITSHTSSTFATDIANWELVGGLSNQQKQDIIDLFNGGGNSFINWEPNTNYTQGQIIVYEGQMYRVLLDFTSGATFDDTNLEAYVPKGLTNQQKQDIIDLFQGTNSTFVRWEPNTNYTTGDLIYYDGQIYEANADFTSSTTFADTYLDEFLPKGLSSANLTTIANAFVI